MKSVAHSMRKSEMEVAHNNAVKLTVRPVTRLADIGAYTTPNGHAQGARPSRPAAYRGRYAYNLLSDERTERERTSRTAESDVACARVRRFAGTWQASSFGLRFFSREGWRRSPIPARGACHGWNLARRESRGTSGSSPRRLRPAVQLGPGALFGDAALTEKVLLARLCHERSSSVTVSFALVRAHARAGRVHARRAP